MVVLVLIRIEYTFFVVSGFNPFLYTILVSGLTLFHQTRGVLHFWLRLIILTVIMISSFKR